MSRGHVNDFNLVISSVADGTRPAAARGTSVTPGNNTYGSYASLIAGASVTDDIFEIWININSVQVTNTAKDCLVTIGVDPAGGTSFSDKISHLLGSCAGPFNASVSGAGGVWYRFPLFIKAGSSIGAKASVNNATVGTASIHVILFGQPSHPELLRYGTVVRTFGENTAASRGTLVTPGTTSDGSYVQLGSALAEPLWYWEWGFGTNDNDMQAAVLDVDVAIGDASNKRRIIPNGWVSTTTAEGIVKPAQGRFAKGAVGDLVYGRAQSSQSADVEPSLIAYGLGG